MGVVAQAVHSALTSSAGACERRPAILWFITLCRRGLALSPSPFDQPEAEQELADGYVEYFGGSLFFVVGREL